MAVRRDNADIPVTVTQGKADVPARLRALDRAGSSCVLATVDGAGAPYASLVGFALMPDGSGVVFATPRKSAKYRNMKANPNVSLLIDTRPGKGGRAGLMKAEAVTVTGRAAVLRKGRKRDEAAGLLISKRPELKGFVDAGTTAVVLVEISRAVHVSGFQHVTVWENRS